MYCVIELLVFVITLGIALAVPDVFNTESLRESARTICVVVIIRVLKIAPNEDLRQVLLMSILVTIKRSVLLKCT